MPSTSDTCRICEVIFLRSAGVVGLPYRYRKFIGAKESSWIRRLVDSGRAAYYSRWWMRCNVTCSPRRNCMGMMRRFRFLSLARARPRPAGCGFMFAMTVRLAAERLSLCSWPTRQTASPSIPYSI
jgi:hypothetical protein